jgi:TM2 domain-containing membrane protein YozV
VPPRAPAAAPRFVAISPDDGTAIDLKNPAIAAFLSWLVPGLGQLYQGRRFKGMTFMVSLVGTFLAGLWIGGGTVVYASWRPGEKRIEFFGQAGIGMAAIPSLVQASLVAGSWRQPLGSGWFAPPLLRGQLVSESYRQQVIAHDPEIGPGDFDGLRFAPRQLGDQLSLWRRRLGRFFDFGTLYTTIAGLLNLLVIYDAWAGPMRHAPPEEDTEESGKGGQKPRG